MRSSDTRLHKLVEKAERLVDRKVPRGEVVHVSIPGGKVEIRPNRVTLDHPNWGYMGKSKGLKDIMYHYLSLMDEEWEYLLDTGQLTKQDRYKDFVQDSREYEWLVNVLETIIEDLQMYDPHERAASLKNQLIKLGAKRKDLRPHIRPVLATLEKEGAISATASVDGVLRDVMRKLHDMTEESAERAGYKAGQPRAGQGVKIFPGERPDEYRSDDTDYAMVSFWLGNKNQVYASVSTYTRSGQRASSETSDWRSKQSFAAIVQDVMRMIQDLM